jgi:hypothetical protein
VKRVNARVFAIGIKLIAKPSWLKRKLRACANRRVEYASRSSKELVGSGDVLDFL